MTTRDKRLAEFDGRGEPDPETPVEVLCEDRSGTYQLPFLCMIVAGQWLNAHTGDRVEARIVGWRLPRSA
jgi:hypothetical protein